MDASPGSVTWNTNSNVPRAIAVLHPAASRGTTTQSVQNPLLGAQQFFAANKSLLRIGDPAAEFALMKSEADQDGTTHLRFKQQYAGVELWASDVYLHTGADGNVTLFNGTYHPTPAGIKTVPGVNAARALAIVDQDRRRMVTDDRSHRKWQSSSTTVDHPLEP